MLYLFCYKMLALVNSTVMVLKFFKGSFKTRERKQYLARER